MRLSGRSKRWIVIAGSTVAIALTVVWILRWRILEDRVRAELAKISSDLFDADVTVGGLEGDLLTSIRAHSVVLTPRPGSVFREFTIRDLEIGYGLFGTGTLDVRMSGAKFAFAPSKTGRKPDAEELLQTARDISAFRFPGRLQVTDSEMILAEGRELWIERGEIDYGTWRVTLAPTTIPVTADAALRFGRVEAELDPGRLSLVEHWEGGLLVSASWNRDESRLEVFWGRGDGDYLAFKGKLEPELDAILTARLLKLDAPVVRALIAGLPVEGQADLEAALGGTPDAPTIDGRLELIGLRIEDEIVDRLVFPLKAEPGALVLPRTTQQTPVGDVTLSARIPFPWVRRGAEGIANRPSVPPPAPPPSVPGDPPPAPGPVGPVPPPEKPSDAPTAVIEVANVEGILKRLPADIRPWIPKGRVQLFGTFMGDAWKVTAKFEGSRYDFPDPVGELTDYVVEAEINATALLIHRLEGMLGGGPVRAKGSLDLTLPGAPLVLDLKGTELLVVSDDLARIRVNPDVKITVTAGPKVKIEGLIEVPLALYYTEFGPAAPEGGRRRDPSAPLGLRLLPAEGGGFHIPGIRDLDRVTLDVRVVSTGECRIENSTIGAVVQGDLRLRGLASSPGVSGRAWVDRGQVRLTTGLFLKIEKGEAILPPDPGHEPFVNFEGSVGRGDRAIVVVINGPMATPTLRLQSNPPRSQEDLLAMIAFGRMPGTLEGSDALGALAGKVIDLYADAWPSPESEVAFWKGIAIDFATGSATARPVPPWELPTRGTARGTMVRTEYLLNDYLSIVAESDREANLSGDLKLRLRFR